MSVKIMRGTEGTSKGFGFVCFKNCEDAMKAREEMNDKDGLFVCRALKKEDRMKQIEENTRKFKLAMTKVNIYVKNLPIAASNKDIEEFLSRFGSIKSTKFFREEPKEGMKEG